MNQFLRWLHLGQQIKSIISCLNKKSSASGFQDSFAKTPKHLNEDIKIVLINRILVPFEQYNKFATRNIKWKTVLRVVWDFGNILWVPKFHFWRVGIMCSWSILQLNRALLYIWMAVVGYSFLSVYTCTHQKRRWKEGMILAQISPWDKVGCS